MSRLRRPFLYHRCIFVTVKLLQSTAKLETGDYERLASSLARMRRKHGFAITAWVFLPDHWHAIIYPPYPLTISTVFKAVKVSSMIGINVAGAQRSCACWCALIPEHRRASLCASRARIRRFPTALPVGHCQEPTSHYGYGFLGWGAKGD